MPKQKARQRTPLSALIFNRRNELSRLRGENVPLKEIAKAVGADPSSVSNWESGKRRDVETKFLLPLAAWLNMPLEQLVAALSTAAAPTAQLSGAIEVAEAKRAVADAGKARKAEQEGAADEPQPVGDEGHQGGGS